MIFAAGSFLSVACFGAFSTSTRSYAADYYAYPDGRELSALREQVGGINALKQAIERKLPAAKIAQFGARLRRCAHLTNTIEVNCIRNQKNLYL